jgi:hypothetical protein
MLEIARVVIKKPLIILLSVFLGRVTYFMMGTITNKNCDFQKEPKFAEAYKAAMKQQYMPDTDIWRYHVNHWAICQAMKLEGDFVECGVYKGSTAMSNMVYIDFKLVKNRKYYLFDTFDGLDKEIATKDEYSRLKDHYPDCYQFVVDSFKKYPNVVIVKGSVPSTLSQVRIDKVSYLSIDMNCAFAEYEAMQYFWGKMVKGGIIVLDDYGWAMCENQKIAADRFALEVGTEILSLPNGQGLIIK